MDARIRPTVLRGVPESLWLPLYFRAVESRRPKPIISDPCAAELIERIDPDFSIIREGSIDQLFAVVRTREFDRCTQAFLTEHPDGSVVDLGCGLDTRLPRVDNGRMRWFGLDLPEVIDLRRKLVIEDDRSELIPTSILDFAWMDLLKARNRQPVLLLAEGVLPYFHEHEVKGLITELSREFPYSQLVFDGMSPALVRVHNVGLFVRRMNFCLGWGIADPRRIEDWASAIRLLRVWSYFDAPEVLSRPIGICRHLPGFRNGAWVAQLAFVPEDA